MALDLTGVAALLALLLLPGLLVVRASWTAVPFLSAAFWIVSWWWLPYLGVGRTRFVQATLLAFAVLTALRLLKPLEVTRPSWPTLLVLSFALARLVPFVLWPVAPGADMSLHSLSALLMVWHDGLPASYEPLLPIPTFGAYTPGLHALAADVSLLSGLAPHRSAFLVSTVSYGFLQVALYALLSRLFRPSSAALAAVLSLGMARAPQAFFGWGGNPSALSLAFVVAAAALLARGTSRAPASAAGLLLGAAVVTHTMMAAAAVAAAPLAIHVLRRSPPGERPLVLRRFAAAGVAAVLAAAPFLMRLDFTMSAGERAWLAHHLRAHYATDWGERYSVHYPVAVLRYAIAALNDAFCLAALAGAGVALRRRAPGLAAAAVSGLLLIGLSATARWGGAGPVLFFPERPMGLLAVVLAVWVGLLVDEALASRRRLAGALTLLLLGGVALERTHRYYLSAGESVMVSADDLEAMDWIRSHTGPLDVICNDYRTAGLWVPALAGRGISDPQVPPFYFDEFREGARRRPCAYSYVTSRSFFGPAEPRVASGRPVFRAGAVTLLEGGWELTSFDTPSGNLAGREP